MFAAASLQGVLDEGPTPPTREFLPYEKAIPLLNKVAKAVEAPLVAVIEQEQALCNLRLLPLTTIWIMITGEQKYEQVFSAAELAPDDYLIKPITPALLMERIQQAYAEATRLRYRFYSLGDSMLIL